MHGRSPPSFFLTKKNPAEASEVDGLMKPLASSSSMYCLIASDSGWANGKILPLGGVVPDINSMAQSTERWAGSWDAFFLLNASARSEYSEGRSVLVAFWTVGKDGMVEALEIFERQRSWHVVPHWRICPSLQEMWGLCVGSQGNPRMIGWFGEWMT